MRSCQGQSCDTRRLVVDRQKALPKIQEGKLMVQLMSYGLTGLAAMLVIAFCSAYGADLATKQESSYGLINNAHMDDSPTITPGTRSLAFRGALGKQQQHISAALSTTAPSTKTRSSAIYGQCLQSARGQMKVSHD